MAKAPETSFIKRLREAVRTERDEVIRLNLRTTADNLEAAIKALSANPVTANMSAVQGYWARGVRMLDQHREAA
jgi:hypothetical protein